MKYDPCFNLLFFQIVHSYITCCSKPINSSSQVTLSVGILTNELCSACNAYRNVRKNWDTQRIGTRLKIVKIIILADPKNWTILRKRKNFRNFSDPKNWDGVFWGPKMIKNVPDFACLQALSTCITVLACKQSKNGTVIMVSNAVLPQGIYLNEIPVF